MFCNLKRVFSVLLFLLISNFSFGADYYWVGGSGNWSDINHWVTTSGGTTNYLQVPTPSDDVFFDANSFTGPNQIVTVDATNYVCRDMNWTGSLFNPSFTGGYIFRIYGSLILIPNMNWNYSGEIYYEATTPGNIITSSGKTFTHVIFKGIGGGWTLTDALTVTYWLFFNTGSLNTNNQSMSCAGFYSNTTDDRTLTLGSSVITIIPPLANPGFTINSTNFVLNAGTSVFKINYSADTSLITGNQPLSFYNFELFNNSSNCTDISVLGADYFDIRVKTSIHKLTLSGKYIQVLNNGSSTAVNVKIDSLVIADTCEKRVSSKNNYSVKTILCGPGTNFTMYADHNDTIHNIIFNGSSGTINGNDARFHKVIYSGNGNINGNNTFDTLSLAAGQAYYLSSGNTQTINNLFSAEGNCSKSILLHSSTNGSQSFIQKTSGSVSTNYLIIRDIKATGGASFVSTNSIDLGGNTGWTITGPSSLNLFWVGNSGNWNDATHWSLTSGGAGGACIPTPIDNVFFDANSFSLPGQIVTINDVNALCNDMDWTNSSNSPTLYGPINNNLRIYGSLILVPVMNWTFQGKLMFESTSTGKTITSGRKIFHNEVYFQGIGGGWTLNDAFASLGALYLISGSLYTNNQSIGSGGFYSTVSNSRTIVLGSSIVTVNASFNTPGFTINTTNLNFDAGTSVFKTYYAADTCLITGDQQISFYDLELINNSTLCTNVSVMGANYFDLRAKTNIRKLTLSGNSITVLNNGYSVPVNIKIDSVTVSDNCTKIIEHKNNYIINTIICYPNSDLTLWADQNDTIQNVYFYGNLGIINGLNAKFHKVIFLGDGLVGGINNTYDSLSFNQGHSYYLGSTQTINNSFIANGTCVEWIYLCYPQNIGQGTIQKSSGSVTINYVILRNMNATGGATFVANNSVDLGNNTGWIINPGIQTNLYWVGGSGNWNDPSHWSLTSGGPGGDCIPSPFNNVFFDANSFSDTGQVVTVTDLRAFCNDMDWTGATNSPTINGYTYDFQIFGSLKLIPTMTFSLGVVINFKATSFGKTITTGGNKLYADVYFDGVDGGWTFTDAFTISGSIYLKSGSLNTNNQNVHCASLLTYDPTIRSLDLGSSLLDIGEINSSTGFEINTNNLTFNAGTSLFRISYSGGTCEVKGNQPISFNNIELTNNSTNCTDIQVLGGDVFDIRTKTSINKLTLSGQSIQIVNNALTDPVNVKIDTLIVNDNCFKSLESKNNYSINSIICNPSTFIRIFADQNDTIDDVYFNGNQGTITGSSKFQKVFFSCNGFLEGSNEFDTLSFAPGKYYLLQSGSTQTINDQLNLRGNGCFPITLQSNISGLQSNISKNAGIVSADYVEMRDQNATGGAQFYAGEYSSNVSNNTGWQFSNAPNYSYGLGPDTSLCQGDTLTLSTINFNGGISWLWQDGTTLPYYKVTQPGTYWVKVTYSFDCFYSDSIHVTQKSKPVATASSNSPICEGDTLKLFGSGGNNYSWIGPSGFSSSDQNPQIFNSNNGNAGNYILSTNQNGCNSDPDTITVIIDNTISPIISINASLNTAPSGVPVTFTAVSTNCGTAPLYQWFVNGISAGTNSPTYTYIPANGDQVMCILTSNLTCAINNPATSNIITVQVTTSNPCPGIPTVDYGGQTYNTVQIGTQCWLRENLNIGTRVDGSANQTNNGIIEKYCYNDIEDSCSVYGGLYQWDEMMGYSASSYYTPSCRQGICPSGWHLPSMAEWDTLIDYLGGGSVAGGPLKETGTRYWQTPNSGATNQSGFSALGGGYRIGAGGFAYLGPYAYYYTSTEDNSINTFSQRLFYDTPVISPNTGTKLMGASVRCLKDYCPITTISNAGQDQMGLTTSCTILNANSPGSQETGTWTIVAGSGGIFDNVNDPVTRFEGTYATSYILKWMITNCCGNSSEDMVTIEILPEPGIPCPGTPSVTYGGQIYHTVQIENQCWMKENLNIGTMIDGATDQTDNGILEKYCFNNDPGNCNIHGGLYQWNELMQYTTSSNDLPSGRQGICPPGWHIPGRAEWDTLIMHTGGESLAGGPLKEMGYCHWSPPNTGANNSTGFTALPGGIRWPGGGFDYLLSYAFIYTATEDNSMNAWSRRLFHNTTVSSENTGSKAMSASVRCVKDTCYNYSTVGITISVNQNPVCNDDTVSFTATPFNGGLNPVFQWKVNAIDQGLNSPSFSYIPVNNDQVICILHSDETCVTGNPDTSNAITITVNPLLPISVSITASNDTVCYGDTVTYTPSVTNGGNSIMYHWFVNDSLVSGSLPCNILNNGLVACYPFNGNANDETSNGNHGTVVGASLTSDRFGNANSAYYFNGIDNYIVMDADSLPTAERTVSLWFNAISVENHPVTLAYGGYSCGQSWFEGINHGGPKYVLESHCEGNLIEATYTDEPVGQWYHWVITTDSVGSKIYINGSVVATDNIFVNDTYVSGKDLAIGVCVAPSGIAPYTDPNVGYFNGKIDDIRIYDRALTASEVFKLYNSVDSSFSYVPFNRDSVYCVVFSSDPCAVNNPDTSNIIVMSVTPNLPVSVTITASENPICLGTSVTFTAIPTNGGSSPVYQWQVNGSNVGTNSSNYIYIPANGDVVTCIITSNATCATGSPATSNAITMTVNSNLPVSILITSSANPVCEGTSVTFTATPTNGGSSPAYQWQVNGSNIGTNSPNYTYAPSNSNIITCILTSNATCAMGSPATSNAVTMTVNSNLPVSVSVTSSENPVCEGTSVTFTATPTNGGSIPIFQWQVNGSNVGTNSTNYTYTPSNGDIITCILTSNANCATGSPATSNAITMTVNSNLPVSVSVTSSSNPICEGTSVTFTATPTNGGSSPAYQWQVNGSNVGTSSLNYTYTPSNTDIVTCILTSNATCTTGSPATSNAITMTVDPNLPVSVTTTASENPVCQGTSVTYIATPTNGGLSPAYQWQVNGSNVGTNSSNYAYTPSNNDIVTCILTSNITCATGSPATSNAITMTVNSNLPVSVSVISSANPVCEGTSVTFTTTPTNGGSSPVYQWQVNGSNVGTNSPIYTYTPSNNDIVTCILTSNATCATGSPATSNAITMTVNSNLPVSVTITASENPACSGTAVSYTAFPVNGGTAPAYQWQINGANTGSNSPTYTYVPGNGDLVLCTIISNENCSTGNPAKSNVIKMEVNPVLPVSLTINLPENPVCAGSEITVTASPVNGGTLPVYQWQLNSINVGSNTPTLTFIPQDGDEVKCLLTSSLPCSTEGFVVSNLIVIGVLPLVSPTIFITTSGNPVCSGETVTLTATITHGGTSPVYLWKVNGTIVGTNTPVITIIPSDGDIITCELTSNEVCTISNYAISNQVTMGVTPLLTVGATITANPEGPVCEGTIVNYSAMTVNGGSVPAYQWRVNGLNVGSNSSQFSYSPSNHDEIICEVLSNANCVNGNPALSNTIWMTANPYLPVSVNITSVSPVPLCSGSTVTITATATNAGTSPDFEWKVNNIPTGINTPEYSYVPTNGDQVQCILSSNINCPSGNPASSNILNMEVIPVSAVSLTITAAQNPLCAGATATITAFPVNGGNAPVYQWKVNGAITGNSTSQLNFLPIESDVITCVLISNGSCVTGNPAISNELVMHLLDKPVVTLNICPLLTTNASRPFPLKGGLPLGGMYFGDCVQGGMFNPSLIPGTQNQTNVMYTYTNIHLCSDSANQQITVLPSNANFSCGESFTDVRDNRIYTTQLIGNKCWMRENLNYGIQCTQIHQQYDNCIPEKYCFANNENNCTQWGGLYQWNELMQYSVIEPIQGLCPPEWHIATALEWEAMVLASGGPGNAGDSLKSVANSNFNALLSGLLYQNMLYAFPDEGTFFWTSTILNPGESIARGINIINPSVSRYHSNHSNAFSTRCIKD